MGQVRSAAPPEGRRRLYPQVFAGILVALYVGAVVASETGLVDRRPIPGIELVLIGVFVGWGVLGSLIVSRRSRHAEGWLLLVAGTVTMLAFVSESVGTGPGTAEDPLRRSLAWFETWIADATVPVLIVLLIVYFPQGRLRTRFERTTAIVAAAMGAVTAVTVAIAPGPLPGHNFDNPYGVTAAKGVTDITTAVLVDGPLLAVVFVMALITLGVRARRSRGDERQQIKWFVYAVVAVVAIVVLGSLASTVGPSSGAADTIGGAFFAMAVAAIPVAITIAVLRYRLYEIDVLINRTLVYVVLTAILAGTYAAIVVVLQNALRPFTEESDAAIAASTLAVAGLFRPARRRVQEFIDRSFYRRRYDAEKVIGEFSASVRDEVDLPAIRSYLESVVRETIQPKHVSVWMAPAAGVAADFDAPPERSLS